MVEMAAANRMTIHERRAKASVSSGVVTAAAAAGPVSVAGIDRSAVGAFGGRRRR